MSQSVIEYVALDILAKVAAITTAAGFDITIVPKRSRRLDFSDASPDDMSALIIQADPEKDQQGPAMMESWVTPFLVQVTVLNSERATAAIDARCNQIVAVVQKQVCADVTRGGYAQDTVTAAPITIKNADESPYFTGVIIPFEVHWRHMLGDPFTKG